MKLGPVVCLGLLLVVTGARGADEGGHPVRVYAPVGSHEDLLPYLVRRLLENGANTSFVSRIGDEGAPIARLIADPAERLSDLIKEGAPVAHPRVNGYWE